MCPRAVWVVGLLLGASACARGGQEDEPSEGGTTRQDASVLRTDGTFSPSTCTPPCTGLTSCVAGTCTPLPPCNEGACPEPLDVCRNDVCIRRAADPDGDGSPAELDCDETNPMRRPGIRETCDGVDQDCDGQIDDGAIGTVQYYVDNDMDGVGAGNGRTGCMAPAASSRRGDDCNDSDRGVFPGNPEICDGADQDCDGTADEDGACPPGCTGMRYDGRPYAFCRNKLNWEDSQAACAAIGMNLVQIDDAAENEFVRAGPLGEHWLAANDRATEGTWVWEGGPPFWLGQGNGVATDGRYSNWNSGEPNDNDNEEDCGRAFGNGRWNDVPCNRREEYACEGR